MSDTSPKAVARLVAEMQGAITEFARFHSCAHTFGERCVVCTGNAVCDTIEALARERDDLRTAASEANGLMIRLCRALGVSNGGDALALDLRVASSDWQERYRQALGEPERPA